MSISGPVLVSAATYEDKCLSSFNDIDELRERLHDVEVRSHMQSSIMVPVLNTLSSTPREHPPG